MKISVTFLKSKYERKKTIEEILKTDADYIHVDIMDGKFVERTVLSIEETQNLFNNCSKPLDIHLMCSHPEDYIEASKNLSVSYITIHAEIDEDLDELIEIIHSLGIKAGLAINPDTTISSIEKYLERIENVLIMGVNPGYGGQSLIPSTVDKISELKKLREDKNYHYQISLDGGVNLETRKMLDDLDIVVAGSYICESNDYQKQIDTLR